TDVSLMNINGLLNLAAWAKLLKGHLVPHAQLPDTAGGDTRILIMVQQNALRALRHEVAQAWSPRRVRDVEGRWIKVRKLGRSPFEEDNRVPLFASEEDLLKGELRAAFYAGHVSQVFVKAPPGLTFPGDPGYPGHSDTLPRYLDFAPRVGVVYDPRGRG